MKKTVRLTESDLIRLVKRIINESSLNMAEMNNYAGLTAADVIDCAKKNNFDLNVFMSFPNDTSKLGQSCQRMLKTKDDKDAMECAFALGNSVATLYKKPGFEGLMDCLKEKILNNMGRF